MNKHSERWLKGYYYSFDETGCFPVDVILSAVARAGKAYHHTESWYDELEPYEPGIHRGSSCAEWIYNAALDAAEDVKALREALETTRGNLVSLEAAHPHSQLYGPWLALVEAALAKADGAA